MTESFSQITCKKIGSQWLPCYAAGNRAVTIAAATAISIGDCAAKQVDTICVLRDAEQQRAVVLLPFHPSLFVFTFPDAVFQLYCTASRYCCICWCASFRFILRQFFMGIAIVRAFVGVSTHFALVSSGFIVKSAEGTCPQACALKTLLLRGQNSFFCLQTFL